MPRIFCFGLWLGLLSSSSFAQLGGFDELYGEGVHRYFANDLSGADQILSQVINAGSKDPRVYYFRGLVHESMGADGTADFTSGARLEAEGKRVVDVGTSLTRVQGRVRTKIEEARRDARIQVEQQQLMLEQARRHQSESSANRLQPVPAPASNESPFPTDSIPANDTGLAPLTPAAPAAPEAPMSDTSDPFGDDAAPAGDATPAAGSDPFGAPAGDTPAPATPAPAPATPAADDPFGAPAGATPASEAPTAKDPFGGT